MASLAADYIRQSLIDFKYDKLEERRNLINEYMDFYTGTNINGYIEPYFDSDTFKEVPVYEMNITKKFINKLSRIYTFGAKRNVNRNYLKLISNKDVAMKHIERMTRLIGTIATQVAFKNGGFVYNPIYFFTPYFSPSDPFNPIAISYPMMVPADDPEYDSGLERFAYFDDEWYIEYDREGNVELEHYHNLGRMPIVFTHREHQIDSFFVEGATDIINCNRHINITLTEMQLGLRYQMFGQPWATGVPEAGSMSRAGTDSIVMLPENASYGIASPAGNLMSVIEALKFQVELVALSNHLYVQFAQDGGETPSGIALQIKDIEAMEDYKDDIELWRFFEKDFYDAEMLIGKANGAKLPNKFGVDFIEPEYPKTVQDQILLDEWAINNNQTTHAKILMRDNQDLTEEEARSQVKANKAENEEFVDKPKPVIDDEGDDDV